MDGKLEYNTNTEIHEALLHVCFDIQNLKEQGQHLTFACGC